MKPLLIIILTLVSIQCFSQISSKWRGNTPGHEHDWYYPSNWSNNRIPDEFTDVIIQVDISSSYRYPVIHYGDLEINSLHIWPGACLTIKNGEVAVLDIERSNYLRSQILGKGRVKLLKYSSEEITHVDNARKP